MPDNPRRHIYNVFRLNIIVILLAVWNLQKPSVGIYNAVEELVRAAEAANMPKTSAQIVNYGLDIIKKTSDFEQALREWYARPRAEHTWINLKAHFTTAHRQLKKIRVTRLFIK